jgi:purine-binding chemotaxis protein CheW
MRMTDSTPAFSGADRRSGERRTAADRRAMTSLDTAAAIVDGGEHRYLTFSLGGQPYALSIAEVTEIIEFRPLTAVPMAPTGVRGVLNLRGRVVPVIDLATRFGAPPTEAGDRSGIVIVRTSGAAGTLGIVVDSVHKVVQFRAGDVEPPPDLGGASRALIRGMARWSDGFIIILDATHLLTPAEEAAALANATPAAVS